MRSNRSFGNVQARQRGAVLVTALLLLLIMTPLAVVTMKISRVQLMAAGNEQFSSQAFQAAESALELEYAGGNFDVSVPTSTRIVDFTDSISVAVAVDFVRTTDIPRDGFSLGTGYGAHHFEINADAKAPRGAVSEQVLGLYIVGANSRAAE